MVSIKNLSISFRFFNLVEYRFWKSDLINYNLYFLIICYVHLFLWILVILIFSHCPFIILEKGLFISLIFSKNQLFISLTLCIIHFFSFIDFSPQFYYLLPSNHGYICFFLFESFQVCCHITNMEIFSNI